jgi:hypothetical protein
MAETDLPELEEIRRIVLDELPEGHHLNSVNSLPPDSSLDRDRPNSITGLSGQQP